MKKSEFKEYLKTEILKMNEATAEDVQNQKEYNAELEKTKELMSNMMEGKMKKSEFKEYLKNEILREMNEQEEEMEDIDVGVDLGGDEEGGEEAAPKNSDNAILAEKLDQMNATLNAILTKEGTVMLDSTKVGTALSVGSYKLQ